MGKTQSRAVAVGIAILLVAVAVIMIVKAARPPDLSWEVDHPSEFTFTNARPQLAILPTKFGSNVSWRVVVAPDGKCMGIKMTPEQIIKLACEGTSFFKNPILAKTNTALPTNEYDFICSLSHNASNAFEKAVTEKFGVRAGFRTIDTDVLVLSVDHAGASGLLPVKKSDTRRSARGRSFSPGRPIRDFADRLQNYFDAPVMDQTGLMGDFVVNFSWKGLSLDGKSQPLEPFNQALKDQLGLELTPQTQPVNMLVIEKAN